MSEIIHVPAQPVTFRAVCRQRCAWCGALLEEWPLNRMSRALESGEPADAPLGDVPTWPTDKLVAVDGGLRYVIEPELDDDGDAQAPDRSCMVLLPLEVGQT